jgi:xanthine dehydrogenase accessory factor
VLRVDAAGRSSREIESFALAGAEGGVSVRGTRESFEYAEQLRIVGTPLWIHGAGHVGRAVVRVLADTPFLIRWLDERTNLDPTLGHDRAADDAAPVGKQAGGASMLAIEHPRDTTAAPIIGSPGDAAALAIEHPEDVAALAATAPEGCFHLVMTHDHDLDYRIVRTLLEGGRFGWLGLIGSETKATCFRIRLAREGLADDQISRLVSPIGIDALSEAGKSPAVIAIGVAAQLLLARQATSTAQPTLGQEFEGGASTHSQSVSSLP